MSSDALSRIAFPDTTVVQLFRNARSAIVLTDPRAPDNPIVACNAAFLELTGYAEEEVVGQNCRFIQGPDTDRDVTAQIRRCVEEERTGQFEVLNYRKDGSTFWNALHVGPIFDEEGRLQYFFGSQYDVSDVVELRKTQMREHKQLTHALQAARAIGTFDWDVAEDRLAVDEGFARAFDLDPAIAAAGLPLEAFYEHVDAADREGLRAAVNEAVRTGDYFEHEYGVQGADKHRWLMGRGRCAHDQQGEPTRFSGVVVDITHRKEREDALQSALDQAETLRREVDHRIKNLFAIVPAIVNMSARGAPDADALAMAVQQRVGALARAHSLTIGSFNAAEGASLDALARAVLDPYTDDRMPFDIEGPPIRLAQSDASGVALVLHELATNAAKYGALALPEGRVRIAWSEEPGVGRRATLRLGWTETGGPSIDVPPERRGSGSRLVDQLMRGMGGRVARDWNPDGLQVRLTVPVTVLPTSGASARPTPNDDQNGGRP